MVLRHLNEFLHSRCIWVCFLLCWSNDCRYGCGSSWIQGLAGWSSSLWGLPSLCGRSHIGQIFWKCRNPIHSPQICTGTLEKLLNYHTKLTACCQKILKAYMLFTALVDIFDKFKYHLAPKSLKNRWKLDTYRQWTKFVEYISVYTIACFRSELQIFK